MEIWRLLDTGVSGGAANMAVDEVLLERVAHGVCGPLVRLYAWDPPCVSFGYGQDPEREVDTAKCRAAGIDRVRRVTGGRAVLHWDELTYSVICRIDAPQLGGSIDRTYRRIGECLVEGLRVLGVAAELERSRPRPVAPRGPQGTTPCFASAARWEVKCAGRKLIGSAQRRWQGALVQHGSLLLGPGHERLAELIPAAASGRRAEVARQLAAGSTDLGSCLGRRPDPTQVRDALAAAFARGLGVELRPAGLDAAERGLVATAATAKRQELESRGVSLAP